ncbi:MAG: adenylate/guanylate cyclase domain-containing protein [Eudoraea sp.]|nr:adenylate/guanylate cyclase domain-containing protein [Eudoraea sp.]NNJ39937.1 adenylate/guanylate cyclase domain-containing protein [Eudoraea sp.]
MRNGLSPKTKRNLSRIIPFGVIWLLVGWFDLLTDAAATGNKNINPAVEITLTPTVFIFASLAVTVVGLSIGALEVYALKDLFSKHSFTRKLFYKFGFYTFFLFLVIVLTYPLAASLELNRSPVDPAVWQKFYSFLLSGSFLSTMISLAFSTFLSLFYAGISDNLGHNVLLNFFTGKYHKPVEENRIFMFLDMKSSTAIAERLGHIRYFEFLREYYNDLSDAIVEHLGQVYQYVGDEIVISWEIEEGLSDFNCIRCFFKMKDALSAKEAHYLKIYGVAPTFKAGIHLGLVTTGEIGALKKEIFFTGDVLNVTARIQGLCATYGEELLVSHLLLSQLDMSRDYRLTSHGELKLKGRVKPIEIFSIRDAQLQRV